MSENKRTIEKYMDGFRRSDHGAILACLTDDVEWEIPGAFRVAGKAEFDTQIENEAFTGLPEITVSSMIEEGEVVVAEGAVKCRMRDGGMLSLVFCDVFTMRGGKIRRLVSYLVPLK